VSPAGGRAPHEPLTRRWVGVLERRGRFWSVTPIFQRSGRVTVARPRDAGAGALVLVEPARGGGGGARVLRSIGDPAVALDLLEGLLLDRGLARRFEPQVEHAARAAAERMAEDPGDRHDLRWLATFTIDPPSAGDFDDAISAEALEGEDGWRVWVHIADVAAHVAPGSPVDEEGSRRGTSVYVPGLVEPMLPGPLSNEACSLVPGRERPAVTVEMVLKGASVLRAAFHRSLIVSDVRLDYDRVDRIFSGAERAEEPWATPLVVAREAAAALAASRRARGALTVESSEPEFQFDDAGAVVGLAAAAATESHSLIEQLMITANEQVATLLEQRGIPALYRVHERPEPAAMQRLAAQLASLEVVTPPLPETLSPSQAEEAAGELSQAVDAHVRRTGRGRRALTSLVLRSLKQARYEPRNLGHAGLRSPRYCHFTSPIRRYPDLVCHRALLSAVGGGELAPEASALAEGGAWASQREREAALVERDADDVARCLLLERRLATGDWRRSWEGEVVGLIGAGAFVAFGAEGGFEGFLPVRRLRGDWWELNEEGTVLRGARGGETVRLGDGVEVEVGRVDAPRGRVDLYPAGG